METLLITIREIDAWVQSVVYEQNRLWVGIIKLSIRLIKKIKREQDG